MSKWWKTFLSSKQLLILLQGFSSGLPLLLIGSTLRVWMKEEGVDLALIGVFAFVGLPYTLKFIWAPIIDRVEFKIFGLRRGWMLIFQVCLALSFIGISKINPGTQPQAIAIMALITAFFAASQDIVIDAYRREFLKDEEMGVGTSMTMTGYRFGLYAGGGFAFVLADQMPWEGVYNVMAVLMGVGILTTLFAPEPKVNARPHSWRKAVIDPFREYFQRPDSILILLFIVFFKMGDSMASDMLNLFYRDMGFSKTTIGLVTAPIAIWTNIF